MKSRKEIMEILQAFDLTHSYRSAGELAGCLHHTMAHWVARRDAGELSVPGEAARGERITHPYLSKIEEWVERSGGRIRAAVVFDKLAPLGFAGSDHTVRRAVAEAKARSSRGSAVGPAPV